VAECATAAIAFLLTLLATLTATLVRLLIVSIRSTPAVSESCAYFTVAFGLAVCLALWSNNRAPNRRRVHGPGFLVLWIVLALLTAFAAPGFGPLFTLPALAGAIAFNWPSPTRVWASALRFALVAAPTVVLPIPAIDFVFQFGQPRPGNPDSSIPSIAAVAFFLAILGGNLLVTFWGGSPHGDGATSRAQPRSDRG
jgi:hypothetical protein